VATRRPSKAEIRRRVRAHNAGPTPPPPLDPEVAAKVDGYEPRGLTPEQWARIRPFVVEVFARYQPTANESARQRLITLSMFVAWCDDLGHPLTLDAVLTYDLVEAFASTAKVSNHTAASYRSRLRGIVGKVNPAGKGPTASVAVAHRAVKPPYAPRGVAAMVRIARTQPSSVTGRQLSACVGLGFGAGLDSVDLKPLLARHLHDEATEGVRIEVPGPRPRTVWVMACFEDLVRVALDGLAPADRVIGKVADRRNVAGKIFENAHILGDAPAFEQSRMRTTWLAGLLTSQVPLPIIMQAAGLTSARTLTDLLPYLDVSGDVRLLRGER
jgi:hypothetical protein